MLHKGLLVGTLVAALLASCLGGRVHATGQAPGVDRDAQAELDAWTREVDVAMSTRAQQLAAQGDVRSLLGAMMITPAEEAGSDGVPGVLGVQPRGWFERARQLAPRDPLVAWVELVDCHVLGCDRGAAVAQLLQVDPDNAAANVWAISDAMHAGDLRAARAQLRSAAAARRYDPHTSPLLRLLLEARSGARLPPMDPQVSRVLAVTAGSASAVDVIAMQSLGQWAAIAMAPLQGVMRLCDPGSADVARDPALRHDCVALLSMLAADDSSLVYAQAATGVLTRMDPALEREWTPRMRQLAWLQEQATALLMAEEPAVPAAEFASRVASDGELEALALVLARAGIPGVPPADWMPPRRLR